MREPSGKSEENTIVFVPILLALDLVLSLRVFDSFSSGASSAVADLLVVDGRQLPLRHLADSDLPLLGGQPFGPHRLLLRHVNFYRSHSDYCLRLSLPLAFFFHDFLRRHAVLHIRGRVRPYHHLLCPCPCLFQSRPFLTISMIYICLCHSLCLSPCPILVLVVLVEGVGG